MIIGRIKLIIVIVILIAVGGLAYWWFFAREISKSMFSDWVWERLYPPEREAMIKNDSFVADLRETMAQFAGGLYDNGQNQFKLADDSVPSLEATYYGVQIIQNLKRNPRSEITPEAVLGKVRSYYASAGYYSEEGREPVFSTDQALAIGLKYQEDLGQVINLDWLKSNSLENENLEPAKLDPQYQRAVLGIYDNLADVDQQEIETRIAPLYMNYYCNYHSSEIPSEDYLRQKYYQTSIVAYFNGLETINNNCFKNEDVEFDKEKLDEIGSNDLTDIKQVYWLYQLQKFYNFRPELKEIIAGIDKFYLTGGFKEKMTDSKPNLIGTYCAILFIL